MLESNAHRSQWADRRVSGACGTQGAPPSPSVGSVRSRGAGGGCRSGAGHWPRSGQGFANGGTDRSLCTRHLVRYSGGTDVCGCISFFKPERLHLNVVGDLRIFATSMMIVQTLPLVQISPSTRLGKDYNEGGISHQE